MTGREIYWSHAALLTTSLMLLAPIHRARAQNLDTSRTQNCCQRHPLERSTAITSLGDTTLVHIALIRHKRNGKAECRRPQEPTNALTSGPSPAPTTEPQKSRRVDNLRIYLGDTSKCSLPFVRELFFGVTYTPNLADWIVYIDKSGNVVTEGLTHDNEVENTPILRGDKAIYVDVFIEGRLPDASEPDPLKAVLQAATLLGSSAIEKDQVLRLRTAFFSDGGKPRPSARRDVLQFFAALKRAGHDTTFLRTLAFKSAADSLDSLNVVTAVMQQLTDSADLGSVERARLGLVDSSLRADVRRVVTGIAKGELPFVELSSGTRADSVVQSVLDYLSNPANQERLGVFRDLILKGPDQKKDVLTIHRSVLQYDVDPFLVRAVTGFGSKFFGAAPTLAGDKAPVDSDFVVSLEDLGHGSGSDTSTHLFVALAKISIPNDVWGRVTINAPPGKRLPAQREILKNFVTTSRSRFGISLAVGVVPDARTQVFDTNSAGQNVAKQAGSTFAVNIYLLGHWRILAAERPRPLNYFGFFQSAGFFAGTNLVRGGLLDEISAGVSIDGLFGSSAELIGGVDRLTTQKENRTTLKVRTVPTYRFIMGLGFGL